ncbi:MAG: hypothetical protein ACKORL_04350, partial [Phycisphaerales bacterium]
MDLTNENEPTSDAHEADMETTRTDGGKTLARGRDAMARLGGPRLADFGVETGKALEPTRRGKRVAAAEAAPAGAQDEPVEALPEHRELGLGLRRRRGRLGRHAL